MGCFGVLDYPTALLKSLITYQIDGSNHGIQSLAFISCFGSFIMEWPSRDSNMFNEDVCCIVLTVRFIM